MKKMINFMKNMKLKLRKQQDDKENYMNSEFLNANIVS